MSQRGGVPVLVSPRRCAVHVGVTTTGCPCWCHHSVVVTVLVSPYRCGARVDVITALWCLCWCHHTVVSVVSVMMSSRCCGTLELTRNLFCFEAYESSLMIYNNNIILHCNVNAFQHYDEGYRYSVRVRSATVTVMQFWAVHTIKLRSSGALYVPALVLAHLLDREVTAGAAARGGMLGGRRMLGGWNTISENTKLCSVAGSNCNDYRQPYIVLALFPSFLYWYCFYIHRSHIPELMDSNY